MTETTDDLAALYNEVSSAIHEVESLKKSAFKAQMAWGKISETEEKIAAIIPATQAEGRIARRGAIRAAIKYGDYFMAQRLIRKYEQEKATPDFAQQLSIFRKEVFDELTRQWKKSPMRLHSRTDKFCSGPVHDAIVDMGKLALPLIFMEMEKEEDHWFTALTAITGANPIKKEHAGRIPLMTQDWLAWGADNGYI